MLVPATVLLLLFPDGQLVAPVAVGRAMRDCGHHPGTVDGVATEPLQDYPNVNNPFAIDSRCWTR